MRKTGARAALLLITTAALACTADPTDLRVARSALLAGVVGFDFNACAFNDLGSAIAAAPSGGTVVVAEGTVLVMSDLLITKSVTIITGNSTCTAARSGAAPQAALSGDLKNRIATLAADVTFEDIVLRDGNAASGGNLYVSPGEWLTLRDAIVTNGVAQRGAGIYALDGATVELVGETRVTDNAATSTGASDEGGGGVYLDNATLLMRDGAAVRDGNSAYTDGAGVFGLSSGVELYDHAHIYRNWASDDGGGVYLSQGHLSLFDGSYVTSNVAAGDGGGVWASSATVTATTTTSISSNEAVGSGGGLWLESSYASFTGATISFNTAGIYGGGLWGKISQVTLVDSYVDSNTAEGSGGGVWLQGGTVQSVVIPSTLSAVRGIVHGNVATDEGGGLALAGVEGTIRGTLITENDAALGGGLSVSDATSVTTSGMWVHDNSADFGGGIYVAAEGLAGPGNLVIDGNRTAQGTCRDRPLALNADEYCSELRDNTATSEGGGLYILAGAVTLRKTAFIGNTATMTGAAIRIADNDGMLATVNVSNALLHDNSGGDTVVVGTGGSFFGNHMTAADNSGYGVAFRGGTGSLLRSIVDDTMGVFVRFGSSIPADCSLMRAVVGTTTGARRTIGVSPTFVTTARGPYRLSAATPAFAVDICPTGLTADLDSDARPAGVRFDRGTFEAP